MIEFIEGNILDSKENYIAQGVSQGNQEGLGTGLALKFSKKWPEVQGKFKKYARGGKFTGGDIWVCEASDNHPGLIYLATQPDMYHATIPYLRKAVKTMAKWAEKSEVDSIAIPKIGSGLGKLSWEEDVKPILIESFQNLSCRLVVYEMFRNELED